MISILENTNQIKELLNNIYKFKNRLKNIENVNIYNEGDKTKIFISLKKIGLSGYELENILRKEFNIQVELANYYGVLLICTIGNDFSDFEILEESIIKIIKKYSKKNKFKNINYPNNIPQKILSPREAFYKIKKSVKIEDSEGEICGENVIPYPPGISMISPGEIITKEIIEYIKFCTKEGMSISGMKDSKIEYIQIIEKE